MELRQLRFMIAVAEDLQFSKAAARLGVSQPTMSERIRLLENEVGAELFSRTSRSVELTPVGAAFLDGARKIVADADRLRETVDDYVRGQRGHLRVGAVGPALTRAVPLMLKEVLRKAPQLEVSIVALSTEDQLHAVLRGELDAGFARVLRHRKGIKVLHLLNEPLVGVLPVDHPLARSPRINLADLNGEPFVVWPRTFNPSFFDRIIATCQRHGCIPGRLVEGSDIQTQMACIGAGLGVSVQPASFRDTDRDDIVFVPLHGAIRPVPFQLAWSPRYETPAVRALRDVALKVGPRLAKRMPGATT